MGREIVQQISRRSDDNMDLRPLLLLAFGFCLLGLNLAGINQPLWNQASVSSPVVGSTAIVWLEGKQLTNGLYRVPHSWLAAPDYPAALYSGLGLHPPGVTQTPLGTDFADEPLGAMRLENRQPPVSIMAPPRIFPLLLQPLPINRANQDELTMLPGIGPRLAGRVVVTRQQQGRFTSLRDLTAVAGIGPKKLEHLRHLITID